MSKHKILRPTQTELIPELTAPEKVTQFEMLAPNDPVRTELLQKFEDDEFIIQEINHEYSINEMREMYVYHPVKAVDPLVFYKGKQIITYL